MVDDIDYNRCQGNAHAGRSNGTMHDRTQTGAGQQGPQTRPAFPVNQMLSARSTEAGTSEALWSSVTCTSFRAGYWDCAPDWWLRERIMPNYILFICVSGGADFILGGRAYRLEPGAVLLAPPHVPQEGRHDPRHPLSVYAVHFAARLYGLFDVPLVYRLPVTVRPEPEHLVLLIDAARRILAEFASCAPGYALAVNAECSRIVALLWREVVAHDPARAAECWERTAEIARLTPTFQLIQARYTQPLTLQDLAQTVPFHPAYFSTFFTRVVGVSPMRYLTRYRLDRARELLLSTDRSVADIAALAGYPDSSYFGRVFRQAEGMRPGEYRKVQRDGTVM
jgi:AraC family transcriptional regulator, arabinose operon regulatory protein